MEVLRFRSLELMVNGKSQFTRLSQLRLRGHIAVQTRWIPLSILFHLLVCYNNIYYLYLKSIFYYKFHINSSPYYVAIGWQASHTNVRRPLISKRFISPLQFGQFAFPKILYFSPYPLFADRLSNTVTIAFRSTPMASRVLASFQIWLKFCRPIALPGVSGWIPWRHRISER